MSRATRNRAGKNSELRALQKGGRQDTERADTKVGPSAQTGRRLGFLTWQEKAPRPWFTPWAERGALSKGMLAGRAFMLLVLALIYAIYVSRTWPAAGGSNAKAAWLFLSLSGFLAWALVLVFALPEVIRGVVEAVQVAGSPLRKWITAAAAFLLLALLPGIEVRNQRGWLLANKEFDDRMAISNSHVLIDSRFDVSQMFFRSFLRVGFTMVDLPVAAMSPAALHATTRDVADNYRRIWRIYGDKNPAGAATHRFPAHGWLGLFFAATIAPLTFRLLQLQRVPALLAMAAGYAATCFYGQTVEVPVTQAFVFAVGILTALVCVAVPEDEKSWRDFLICGLALGFAGLTMNTLAIIGAAIAAYQLTHLVRSRSLNYLAGIMLCYAVAGAFILIWYERFLRGFVFETKLFNLEVQEVQALMKYRPISWAHFSEIILRIYGHWYLLALAGIVALSVLRLQTPGISLMLPWALFSLAVLPTMPFLFARFVMYSIPPACWLMAMVPLAFWNLYNRFNARPEDSFRRGKSPGSAATAGV